MIREIVKDPIFLARRSRDAAAEDLPVALDLLDTLEAHKQSCVGMAANMIGQTVRIIAFYYEEEDRYMVMLNPEILRKRWLNWRKLTMTRSLRTMRRRILRWPN